MRQKYLGSKLKDEDEYVEPLKVIEENFKKKNVEFIY